MIVPNPHANHVISNSFLSTKPKEYLINLLFDDRSSRIE